MRRFTFLIFIHVCLCLVCGLPAMAENKPAPAEIKKLMAQLGGESFRDRRAASKRLTEIGEPAIPFLMEGAKSTDPEIKMRCAKILDAIGYVPDGGYNKKRYAEVKIILDEVRSSGDARLGDLVKNGSKYIREIMQVCREGEGSSAIYGMIALARIEDPKSFPVLAGLFSNSRVSNHMSGYVSAIKDPFLVYCMIREWQADTKGGRKELTQQVYKMFRAAEGKDDADAVMKMFMEKHGDDKKLQANIKWLKKQDKPKKKERVDIDKSSREIMEMLDRDGLN